MDDLAATFELERSDLNIVRAQMDSKDNVLICSSDRLPKALYAGLESLSLYCLETLFKEKTLKYVMLDHCHRRHCTFVTGNFDTCWRGHRDIRN